LTVPETLETEKFQLETEKCRRETAKLPLETANSLHGAEKYRQEVAN